MTSFSIIGGTGALGGALARRLASAGHEIWIGSRDAERGAAFAASMAADIGQSNVRGDSYAGAAAKAEICVLTVPYAAHAETLAQVKDAVRGKIVVDTTVPLKPPKVGTVQLPEAGCAAVETAQALDEGARVVSALQNIGAEKLGSGGTIDADVLVTSNDAEAAEVIRGVLAGVGLKSWFVGPLANSAAAEALASVLIQLNRRYKLGQAGVRITGGAKPAGLSVKPVADLPMFAAGDDLAGAIASALTAAGEGLEGGDVVVVAQKVVSKAEGRTVALSGVTPSAEAKANAFKADKDPTVIELVMAEAEEVVRVAPGVIITRNRAGHVLANSGVDVSNVESPEGDQTVLLWPADPDASAAKLRAALQDRFGVTVAVVISDSLGRPWRLGTTGAAIGAAGMKPLRDRCGETDLFGRELQATIIGVADEIAAAASLVMGEAAEGTPVVVVRGATYDADETQNVNDMMRPAEQDLFR